MSGHGSGGVQQCAVHTMQSAARQLARACQHRRHRGNDSLPSLPLPPRPTCPRRVIYLEDNDIVHMKGGEYTVFNWSDVDSPSVEVRRTIQTLSMEVSQIMKVWRGCTRLLIYATRATCDACSHWHAWRRLW